MRDFHLKVSLTGCFVYDYSHKGNWGAEVHIFISLDSATIYASNTRGPRYYTAKSIVFKPWQDSPHICPPLPRQAWSRWDHLPTWAICDVFPAATNSTIRALILNLGDLVSNPWHSPQEGLNLTWITSKSENTAGKVNLHRSCRVVLICMKLLNINWTKEKDKNQQYFCSLMLRAFTRTPINI